MDQVELSQYAENNVAGGGAGSIGSWQIRFLKKSDCRRATSS